MRSGKLRYRIVIEEAVTQIDDHGTPQDIWVEVATIRAELVQQSTTEYLRNQGAADEELVIFRTRYLGGVTNAMRVMFDGQPHNIREVAPDPMRRHMELRTVSPRVV